MQKINEENEPEIAELVDGKRVHTTFNILASTSEVLSLVARERGMTKTEIIDESLKIACGKFKDTTKIDDAISATNGYWFERDLVRFQRLIGDSKDLCAYQLAHLFVNLNNNTDRARVFETLRLSEKLDELTAMNDLLESACKASNDKVVGFNISKLANGILCKLTELQIYYLQLIVGAENVDKIKKLLPDKFHKKDEFFADGEVAQEIVDLFPQDN